MSEFQRTGFRGGLNRYRNMDRDWEDLAHLQGAEVRQPALFIAGERDPVLSFTSSRRYEDARARLAKDGRAAGLRPLDAAGASRRK